ncbi:MAG: glycosyl hydrolase 115 family protein [Bacteroidales bacterium]|nr:glycosyl hydrolase 115 family protein [Bacteroidales bacterium]MBN2761853.1 glycosyl hydrolase 115 family protein [Bacteroidales bacterium]
MNQKLGILVLCLASLSLVSLNAHIPGFILYAPGNNPAILIDNHEDEIISLSAGILSDDIERVTGYKPPVINKIDKGYKPLIVVGTLKSEIICQLNVEGVIVTENIRNKWEVFSYNFIHYPGTDRETLVITGSDNRGTAYGVFHLSGIIGVSPWYWWNDISPEKRDSLVISREDLISAEPSVKYRGIFLNDEDWGLHPWASQTFEPETGDIGPKTYEKIFELLLRLRANTIWPAMHDCTKAFFHYPRNVEMARKYNIVIGSSHAEPMLRNNVDEWNRDSLGEFNYRTNKENVCRYWEERVRQAKDNEAIYTLGMRGIHDSGMEGFENLNTQKLALEQIITDQRQILRKHIDDDVTAVPQVFIPYKEVLDIYDNGMSLPEDICLMWTDDNYGYIRRLNKAEESFRTGGSGLYYHISYWGRPHDYLWLSTTHPLLIWEELTKAYLSDNRTIWIVNVGDIKPCEYNMQLFLDMAYDISRFSEAENVNAHFSGYHKRIFGRHSPSITQMLWKYYILAFERRPEFMGWSRTEPSTQTNRTAYNHFFYGDEAQKRIDAYDSVEKQAKKIMDQIDSGMKDAYFQLVYYPVVCASYMNKKFLYADKASYYARYQNRLSASDYAVWAEEAYLNIRKETERYNNDLANGKWLGMMNSAPRNLSVFQRPQLNLDFSYRPELWACMPEGYVHEDSCLFQPADKVTTLPVFTPYGQQKRYIDVYLLSKAEIQWDAKASDNWIILSDKKGTLDTIPGNKEKRIWISVDWPKLEGRAEAAGSITIKASGESKSIGIKAENKTFEQTNYFAESNGLISIFAENFSRINGSDPGSWKRINGLGHTGHSMVYAPDNYNSEKRETNIAAAALEYDFCSLSSAPCSVIISCLPVHPLNTGHKLRLAICIDDSSPVIVDLTTYGRSEEWKQNVLSNKAGRLIPFPSLKPGFHTLKIKALDPAVVVDYIIIDLGGLVDHYETIEETGTPSF